MNSPLDYFEKFIRLKQESKEAPPDLKIDELLEFSEAEMDRIFDALQKSYTENHWATERANFRHVIEAAMQLLVAGLCPVDGSAATGSSLDCCARIVNAPSLSPYSLKTEYNFVIIPTGFISTLEKFISTTYGMAAMAVSQYHLNKTVLLNRNILLSAITKLADEDVAAFTHGVMEASSESSIQQILEYFPDPISFIAFDREIHSELIGATPALVHTDFNKSLHEYPEIKDYATKIARLSVCFVICHEFGHTFTRAIPEQGTEELSRDEKFTDSIGSLLLYRLIQTGTIATVIGSEITPQDMSHALVAFHAWNLSKELSGLLKEQVNVETALTQIHEVAARWHRAMIMIRKMWTDDQASGETIITQWGVMIAGMLRVVLLKNNQNVDMETACNIVPLLVNRNSKIYSLLSNRT